MGSLLNYQSKELLYAEKNLPFKSECGNLHFTVGLIAFFVHAFDPWNFKKKVVAFKG